MEQTILNSTINPPLRPINELLDTAFNFFLKNWKKLVPFQILASLMAIAPLAIILIIYAVLVAFKYRTNSVAALEISTLNLILGGLGIGGMIFLLMTILGLQIAKIKYVDNPEKIWIKFKEILLSRRLWGYLCLNILTILIVLIGLIFLIIPGLVAAIFLNLTGFYYIIGDHGIVQSIKLSINSVKKSFWEFLLRIIVLIAIGILIGLIANILSSLFIYLNNSLEGWGKIISMGMLVLVYLVNFIIQQFLMIFTLSYKYNVFIDFKK